MRVVLVGIKLQAAFQFVTDEDEVLPNGRIVEQTYTTLTEFAATSVGALREAWEELRKLEPAALGAGETGQPIQ